MNSALHFNKGFRASSLKTQQYSCDKHPRHSKRNSLWADKVVKRNAFCISGLVSHFISPFSHFSFHFFLLCASCSQLLCGLSLRTLRTCLCLTALFFSSIIFSLLAPLSFSIFRGALIILLSNPLFYSLFISGAFANVFFWFSARFFKDICVCASVKREREK